MHSRSVFEWIPSLRTLLVEEHGSAMDNNSVNHLLELQLSSSNTDIQQQLDRLPLLNLEQRAIFDAVLASVNNNAGTENQKNVYFVDGPAGSGIAASNFAPLGVLCTIYPGFQFNYMKHPCATYQREGRSYEGCKILIIDEITMLKGVGLDVLSQSLCDLLERNDAPFGGLVVVMGGDFRQVLPILRHAGRATTVHSTVLQSKVWQTSSVNVMQLSENMRLRMDLQNTNANPEFQEVLSHFASFLLRIGEDMEPSPINLPSYIFQPQDTSELVEHVFDDFSSNEPAYWSERAILCPKNKDVQRINDMVTSRLPHDEHVFLSIDNIISEEPNDPAHTLYPPEFLNSLELSGLPPHCLTLKKACWSCCSKPIKHTQQWHPSLFAVSHSLSSSV
ncbi:helicase [Fragilaria crotonensis]|nr:helicase [Fragilaria crotonensis]